MTQYVNVGRVSDFREGKVRRELIEGQEIGIVLNRGVFCAFTNRCPHQFYPLHFAGVQNDELLCLSHGARFAVPSGLSLEGPNYQPPIEGLVMHDVRVVGDAVEVCLRS